VLAISDVWGTVPPVLVLVPPLEGAPLWMIACFLWPTMLGKKLFEEDFVGREGDLECILKISMKVPVCGG